MTDNGTPSGDGAPDNVVPLGTTPEPVPDEPPRAHSGLHRIAISGMALSALVGIVSMLAFITVSWPNDTGRYVIGVFIAAGVGFMTCASLAVLSAARETYAVREKDDRSA